MITDNYRIHLQPQESRKGWVAYIYRPNEPMSVTGATQYGEDKAKVEESARAWINADKAHPLPPDEWIEVE